MRILAKNTIFFLGVYLPLTLLIGILVGAFVVEGADDGLGYEIFLWVVIVLQMIVPTLVAYALIFLTIRTFCLGLTVDARRYISIGSIGLLLPVLQAYLWQGVSYSFTWILVTMLPAVILGGVSRYPIRERVL